MFNNLNKTTRFTFNSDSLDFISLDDYVKKNKNKGFVVKAVFVHKKGKKSYPCIVSEKYKIWLPAHLTEVCETICNSPEMIEAINEGHCKVTPTQYEKTGEFAGTYNTLAFEDI